MSSDPQALLTVLLAMTGLTQTEAAALVGVASRTVRRWMEGVRKPPAVAMSRRITPSVEKWRRQAPPRYAALPLHAVTNFPP